MLLWRRASSALRRANTEGNQLAKTSLLNLSYTLFRGLTDTQSICWTEHAL
jgi:hypothetical protein